MSYIIQSAFGGAKIPKAVMDSINENAINYPKDVRASWKENQIESYLSMTPEYFGAPESISYEIYAEMKKSAEQKHPKDFRSQFLFMKERIGYYLALNNICLRYNEDTRGKCENILKKYFGSNIQEWINEYAAWADFFTWDYINNENIEPKMAEELETRAIEASKGRGALAKLYMSKSISSYKMVRDFKKAEVSDEVINDIREELSKKYPYDFERQYRELYVRAKKDMLSKREMAELSTMKEIMNCVFIKRINNSYNATAVLVNIMGHDIILCTKEFIPDRFPCTITNATGSITCERAIISKDFKILALLPGNIPKGFNPIKISEKPIEAIEDLKMVTPTIEGTYITNVAFSTRTTDLFSNMTYKNNITMNLDTGIYFKTHKYAKIGSLVKIEKGISLDRSLLFDIKTKALVSIATDLNEDKTDFYSYMTQSVDKKRGLTVLKQYMMRQFNIPVKELDKGKVDKEVSFVDVNLINKEDRWEKFDARKYFDSIAYLKIIKEETEEIAWFTEFNTYAVAFRCKLFHHVCARYHKDLFTRTTKDTFIKTVKSFYISLYIAMKSTYLRSVKYERSNFYILNRFDIIAVQELLEELIRDFEGRFKNAQIETFLARDIYTHVRRYYW